MRKFLTLSAAALTLGAGLAVSPAAEARPGYGYGPGYGRGYAYRGYRRGYRAGPAIAAGVAGLALGALAAQQYRSYPPAYGYGYYGRPAYGYGYYGY